VQEVPHDVHDSLRQRNDLLVMRHAPALRV
jgi:hypothetical protein